MRQWRHEIRFRVLEQKDGARRDSLFHRLHSMEWNVIKMLLNVLWRLQKRKCVFNAFRLPMLPGKINRRFVYNGKRSNLRKWWATDGAKKSETDVMTFTLGQNRKWCENSEQTQMGSFLDFSFSDEAICLLIIQGFHLWILINKRNLSFLFSHLFYLRDQQVAWESPSLD